MENTTAAANKAKSLTCKLTMAYLRMGLKYIGIKFTCKYKYCTIKMNELAINIIQLTESMNNNTSHK